VAAFKSGSIGGRWRNGATDARPLNLTTHNRLVIRSAQSEQANGAYDPQRPHFQTLADPTRRAIFERLCLGGEQTVGALTSQGKVSQPAVSKHLALLKKAGLVRDRQQGRETHYSPSLERSPP
jgi:predicted transcriptional regulator